MAYSLKKISIPLIFGVGLGLLVYALHPQALDRLRDYSEARIGDESRFQVEEEEAEHPYGKPVVDQTRLWWEEYPEFRRLSLLFRTTVRLAAFQTTLPHPQRGEEHNIKLAAQKIRGQVIAPGAVFSTNSAIGPRTTERGFKDGPAYYGSEVRPSVGGGVCKVASTLYNVAVLANLEIIERWPHSMPVPYVPPGQDATIAVYKDFKFRNSTEAPLLIWAENKGQTLYIAFYGRVKPPKVTWHHEVLNRWPARIIYRENYSLRPGEERVLIPGADGLRVRSWLTIEDADGKCTVKELGVDYYYPLNRVIERHPLSVDRTTPGF